jgi:Cutinase
MRIRWISGVVVVAMLLLTGMATWFRSPVSPTSRLLATVHTDAGGPCVPLELVGLRGAGDPRRGSHPGGDDVHAFWRVLESALMRKGILGAELYPLPYEQAPHAAGGAVLIPHEVTAGATLLTQYVAARRTRCPQSRIIVAGQSEGAAIVHWAYPRIASRVDGVVLFGDPLRMPGARYDRPLGAVGPPSLGTFVVLMDSDPRAAQLVDPIPPQARGVQSFCLPADPICGFNPTYPGSHLSYRNDRALLDSAAAFVTTTIGA